MTTYHIDVMTIQTSVARSTLTVEADTDEEAIEQARAAADPGSVVMPETLRADAP